MRTVLKSILLPVCLLSASIAAYAQVYTLSGTVCEKESGAPVEFATVVLEGTGQWAVADAEGSFVIKNVSGGKNVVSCSCLGYVSDSREITITRDILNYKIVLAEDNLTLQSVVVTAKENENSATTSRTIDRTALDHVQVLDVANISSLLPGGATVNPNLTGEQNFNLRADKAENGNASFGTAVEVDGVRLSNNASFAELQMNSSNVKGASTNNIASSNVESVEVITGVPSVEYGDMTSGVVKINTRKGKTPYMVTMSTTPNNKQFSLSKGFGLGTSAKGVSRGVLNASAEYTKSVSETMSPFDSYTREQINLTYSNLASRGLFAEMPLRYSFSLTGNLGGLDDSADPDLFKDTYTRTADNAIRGNVNLNWLLNRSWITNIELVASASYADKHQADKQTYKSSVSAMSLHGREMGYYMAAPSAGELNAVTLINPGYWYSTMLLDDKPFTYKVTLKANWAKNFGNVNNKLKIGGDLTGDKNFGIGRHAEDPKTAPTFREYRYCDVPWMTGVSPYIEDNLMIPVGKDGRVNLIAGLRYDNTIIKGSAYGVTSSLSPRFNAKYTVFTDKGRRHKFVKELSFRGSWGVAVKQPSFSILYPEPKYLDINVFTSTAAADNTVYSAYFIMPRTIEYSPGLRWQRNKQSELGMDINLGGVAISLAGYYNRTFDSYRLISDYEPFRWKYTGQSSVQGIDIPASNRIYSIAADGVVTVTDDRDPSYTIKAPYVEKNQFLSKVVEDNDDSPVTRYGLEWVIDFPKINVINTSVRVDGNFYGYKSVYTDLVAYSPQNGMSVDGSPYKYIGWFYGGDSSSNGSEKRSVSNNVTITTHIPQVRMIFSLKVESTLLKYSRTLSDRLDGRGARSYVMTDRSNLLSFSDESIYNGDNYVVFYPDYYSSIDDPETRHNFLEELMEAKQNNPELYADLSKLVQSTPVTYTYKKDYMTPYFNLNFSVTKEIGDVASVSLYANNFINNIGQIHSSKTGEYVSVTSYIPKFYYGLTLRLKF